MGGSIQQLFFPVTLSAGLIALPVPGLSPSAWQAQLKTWLQRGLAHPVQLGRFQGFTPAGLSFAASEVLAGPSDDSSLRVRQLLLQPDLPASLRQRRVVAKLGLKGAELNLRRNRDGRYWVFPRGKGKAPNLLLRFELLDGARLNVEPGGSWQWDKGELDLDLGKRQLALRGRLRPAGRSGQSGLGQGGLGLNLVNSWSANPALRLGLELERTSLPALAALPVALPVKPTAGRVSGVLLLERQGRRWSCSGPLRIVDLSLRRQGLAAPIKSPLVRLGCRGQELQLLSSRWGYGPWAGSLAGRWRWAAQGSPLQLSGSLDSRQRLPAVRAEASLSRAAKGWLVKNLELRAGPSLVQASGSLQPRLALATSNLQLEPRLFGLRGAPIGGQARIEADRWYLKLPETRLLLAAQPLLLRGQASGSWRRGKRLEQLLGDFRYRGAVGGFQWLGDRLQASGSALGAARPPLRFKAWWQPSPGKPWRLGRLWGEAQLQALPLAQLAPRLPLRGVGSGNLSLDGSLAKPLWRAQLELQNPGLGPLSWTGLWRGSLRPGELQLSSNTASLRARLQGTRLLSLVAQQGDGQLRLLSQAKQGNYRWFASRWSLAPLRLQLPSRQPLPMAGLLQGEGSLAAVPFRLEGKSRVEQPRLATIRARDMQLQGVLRPPGFDLSLRLLPQPAGLVTIQAKGAWGGQLDLQGQGRDLAPGPLLRLWRALRQPEPVGPPGTAADLGGFAIAEFGASIDAQLQALLAAEQRLAKARPALPYSRRLPLDALRGRLDADLGVRGAKPSSWQLSLAARGNLWFSGQDRDLALQRQPLIAEIKGPVNQGEGSFSFSGLPLGLIALLTPVPASLRGSVSARGKWSLGRSYPSLAMDLQLQDAALKDQPLNLERGRLKLQANALKLDLALRGGAASSSIDLSGSVPLDAAATGLELRLSSRNDGLVVLSALSGGELEWRSGSADLQLLVRGSRTKPLANGFLRVRDGNLQLAGQVVNDLQAALFFDFEKLQLEELKASLGSGNLQGKGSLPLLAEEGGASQAGATGLEIQLKGVPFKRPNLGMQVDGELRVGGSLDRPLLGGDLSLSRGRVQVAASQLSGANGKVVPLELRMPESRWNFKEPLVLLGPSVESSSGAALRRALPNLSFLRFQDLRLSFGPDLRLTAPPVADFSTAGLLTLNGPAGPDISVSGVVRLLQGRVNVFTSTLRLDANSPNVAVFTPSLGLIPYLDLALSTRVSDQVRSQDPGGPLTAEDTRGNFSSLDRLNLVKVLVRVTGPADRIGENLDVRSTPPLPRERVLALLGGNTLAGLSGGDAGTALVTVLGQTLLTPVVGGFSELLGQRLNVALYPAYLDPYVTKSAAARNLSNRRIPSQLVLGSEVGLDITDRLNFSVLSAPNRSDIPPEAGLRFQASDNLGLQGAVDQLGRWQGQLQLFFRF
jgi:translocation and assembly module TamB